MTTDVPTPRDVLATELLDAVADYLNAIKSTFVIFEPAEDRLRKAYNAVVQEAALTRRRPMTAPMPRSVAVGTGAEIRDVDAYEAGLADGRREPLDVERRAYAVMHDRYVDARTDAERNVIWLDIRALDNGVLSPRKVAAYAAEYARLEAERA